MVIAIIGTLVGLLLPAVQAAREAARRSSCSNNLKQLSLGMQNFHEARRHFPWIATRTNPPGNEDLDVNTNGRKTWVVFLWPFIEQSDLYNSYNFNVYYQDWSTPKNPGGPVNGQLILRAVPTYYCSSDRPNAVDSVNGAKLNYLVNTGTSNVINPNGPFGWKSGNNWGDYKPCKISSKDISDGLSKTLLFGEVMFSTSDTPSDSRGLAFNDVGPPGFMTLNTPNSGSDMLHACNNTAQLPCSTLNQPPYRYEGNIASRSRHSGGVGVSMCDGAVGFISDSIDLATWRAMSTAKGGETATNTGF